MDRTVVTYSIDERVLSLLVRLKSLGYTRTWIYTHWIKGMCYEYELSQAIELGLVRVDSAACGINKGLLHLTDKGNAWVQMRWSHKQF